MLVSNHIVYGIRTNQVYYVVPNTSFWLGVHNNSCVQPL